MCRCGWQGVVAFVAAALLMLTGGCRMAEVVNDTASSGTVLSLPLPAWPSVCGERTDPPNPTGQPVGGSAGGVNRDSVGGNAE